jgi:translation initiation factor IF-3
LRLNREIRAREVRVIGIDGEQCGIMSRDEAQKIAIDAGVDLVEIAPTANPPVCKIIDYGKYRYDQTRREKENKKAQHRIKVKEIKVKPNIDEHDFNTKLKHARDFIIKGNKVKVSCMFRGREITHTEIGRKVVERMVESLEDIAMAESRARMYGRSMIVVMAPLGKNKSKS